VKEGLVLRRRRKSPAEDGPGFNTAKDGILSEGRRGN